jgi:hypothetical protein
VGDVTIGLQIIVGLIEPDSAQRFFGDLDQDEQIGIADAVIGLQHIVGLIPALNRCGPRMDG